jgi:Asp-tRNA(Asn)/Glu-tRNA(Gln) amidotransferase A subunit family amidase
MDTALYLMRGERDFDSPRPFDRPLVEAARTSPGKLRIACTTKTILPVPKATEVIDGYEETIALLRSLGHEVTDAAPNLGPLITDFYPLYFRGIRDEGLSMPHPERLSDHTKGFVRLGRLISDRDWRRSSTGCSPRRGGSRSLRDFDVLHPATASCRWKSGTGGVSALRTINGMSNVIPTRPPELHRTARRDHPSRLH